MSDEEKIKHIKEMIRLKGVNTYMKIDKVPRHDREEIMLLRGMREAYGNAIDIIEREWRK